MQTNAPLWTVQSVQSAVPDVFPFPLVVGIIRNADGETVYRAALFVRESHREEDTAALLAKVAENPQPAILFREGETEGFERFTIGDGKACFCFLCHLDEGGTDAE